MATINNTKLSFKYVPTKAYSELTDINPSDIIFVASESAIYVNGTKFGIPESESDKITDLETALNALKYFSKVAGDTGLASAATADAILSIKGGDGIVTSVGADGVIVKHSNTVEAGTAQGDNDKELSFGSTFTIPTVTYDANGHVTGKGVTTMTMPSNPNTDTKVTSVDNHYAPVADGDAALTAGEGKYVSGVTRDAKGHIVGLTTTDLPSAPTLEEGTTNGTIKYNGTDVPVHGLGSAAYTDSTAYATADQGTKADNAVPNTRTVNSKALSADITLTGDDIELTGYAKGANSEILATDTINSAFGKTQGQIDALKGTAVGAMHFKGIVEDYASLPDNAEAGDVYIVRSTGKEYVWNGASETPKFEEFGDQSQIGQLATKVDTLENKPGLDKVGTVTSISAEAATDSNLTVTGGPVTESGTITVGVATGYSIPSTADATKWDSAAVAAGTALQSVREANEGTYISVAAEKSGTSINLTPSVTVQAVAASSTSAKGLAEASDVKNYVDNSLTWEEYN